MIVEIGVKEATGEIGVNKVNEKIKEIVAAPVDH
jgi:hypothetical protein